MTALITALILNLHASTGIQPHTAKSVIEIHRLQSATSVTVYDQTPAQELSMRDWKLLMPNWKPKTTAFAIAEPPLETKLSYYPG
jgi:hypothetical protein